MRNLTLVCAGLAVMGGVVSVHLWRELRAEREMTAQLRAGMEQLRAGNSIQPATARFAASQQPSGVAAAPVPEPQGAAVSAGPANSLASALALSILDQREMMNDPEYRKAQLAQLRLSLRQSYPGLVEELGLSAEEADRLFTLLAEGQMEMSNVNLVAGPGGAPDPVAMEAANRRRQELQQQQEQQVQAMLGGRYGQWQDYQKTRPARTQVASLARTFESIGTPITTEQSRSLLPLYVAEQERQREESSRMQGETPDGRPDLARRMEEQANAQIERNRRLVEGARSILNARQLEALQTTLDQQVTIARLSARMARQQQDALGEGNAPSTTGVVIQAGPMSISP